MNSLQITNLLDNIIATGSKIGIFVSGGFDSGLILYSLFRIYDYKNIDQKLLIYVVPRYDGNIEQAEKVIRWAANLYPKCQYNIEHPGDPSLHHTQHVISGIREILGADPTIKIILGDTKIPQALSDNAPLRIKSSNSNIIQPFIDCDKTTTIKIAEQYGILDNLAQVSSTCTEKLEARCRTCWQCLEREWAFKKLGLFDSGLM